MFVAVLNQVGLAEFTSVVSVIFNFFLKLTDFLINPIQLLHGNLTTSLVLVEFAFLKVAAE